jgi:tight adherence protein B
VGGLTAPEAAAAFLGTALVVRFLLRAALPAASHQLSVSSARYSDALRDEFVHLPPARIANGLLVSGLLCGVLVLAGSGSLALAAASGAAPAGLAGAAIRRYRTRRRRRIRSQLPAFLDLVAGHVKAGHSFPESLSETVPLLPSGIREEIAWVLQKCRLGTHLAAALTEWEERMPADEISLIVRPLRTALPGGGNLVDLLERTRDILVRQGRTRDKLRSMTAQARLQAGVLTLLPPVFMAILSVVDPASFADLVGTPRGHAILAVSAVLQILGWCTIRRILGARP